MHLNSCLFLFKLNKTNAYFHTTKTQKTALKNEKNRVRVSNVFFLRLNHHNAFDMREKRVFFTPSLDKVEKVR